MKHFTTVFKENKSIFLEFALIFAFFILPPLIQGPSVGGKISIAGGGKFSASIFVQLILTALLLLQNKFKPILPVENPDSLFDVDPNLPWTLHDFAGGRNGNLYGHKN